MALNQVSGPSGLSPFSGAAYLFGPSSFEAELSTPSLGFSAQSLEVNSGYTVELTAAAIGFTAQDLTWTEVPPGLWSAELSAATMSIAPNALDFTQDATFELSTPAVPVAAQALTIDQDWTFELTTPVYTFSSNALIWTGVGSGSEDRDFVRSVVRSVVKSVARSTPRRVDD